jgi:hypothetical protein
MKESDGYATAYETGPFGIQIFGKNQGISKDFIDALNSVEWVMDFAKPVWKRSIFNKRQPLVFETRDAKNSVFTALPFLRTITSMSEFTGDKFRIDPKFRKADEVRLTDLRMSIGVISKLLSSKSNVEHITISCSTVYKGEKCLEILQLQPDGKTNFVRHYVNPSIPSMRCECDPAEDGEADDEQFKNNLIRHALKMHVQGGETPVDESGNPALVEVNFSEESLAIDPKVAFRGSGPNRVYAAMV